MAFDEKLAQRISTILGETTNFLERKMFGGTGYLIKGNMACGVYKDNLIVRLSETEYDQALAMPFVGLFDITGRPMKGWITVKPGGLKSDKELRRWVEKGLNFAKTLPEK
jgi:TfoX/Sxy family transcriptional regulator of competence genes